jgi:hypothetical protein
MDPQKTIDDRQIDFHWRMESAGYGNVYTETFLTACITPYYDYVLCLKYRSLLGIKGLILLARRLDICF